MSLLDVFRKKKTEPNPHVGGSAQPAVDRDASWPTDGSAGHEAPDVESRAAEPAVQPPGPTVGAAAPHTAPEAAHAPASATETTAGGEAEPSTPATADAASSGTDQDDQAINDEVVAILKTVYDPEIPVDIYELGLIYEVDVRENAGVYVQMTLTSPMCPVAESLPIEVEAKVRSVPGVSDVELDLVWEPPWNMDMMSEAAKLELNML